MTPKKQRGHHVYKSILAAIQQGIYARGERIREDEVARSLGVSRTPVREALSRLQARGLLEMSVGGLVVTELTRPQIIELYAVREILEGSAARFAAQHASPAEIASMHHLNEAFGNSLDDVERITRINRDLHRAIGEAAHNHYLLRLIDELRDSLALLAETTLTVKGRPEKALAEHTALIDAIARRNPDDAEHFAREHILRAHEARMEMLVKF